eukprot:NODE_26447_length_550_cov_4.442080.p2 GENE.NODE_26447_length_550_cov_4.442080~~NODE_26447_length_550_cov_4.442080.p2  ORF type:complete len:117 (-),score=0.78 NODE_26447_length_550_cov_4.442080:139-489(-)
MAGMDARSRPRRGVDSERRNIGRQRCVARRTAHGMRGTFDAVRCDRACALGSRAAAVRHVSRGTSYAHSSAADWGGGAAAPGAPAEAFDADCDSFRDPPRSPSPRDRQKSRMPSSA